MKKINQELFIAILDDDPDFAYVLSRMIEKVLGAGKVQVHIQTFRTTQEADTSPLSFDLLFLDVELGNENGIQWVKKWKKTRKFQDIIIASSYDHYVFDSIEARPFAYIRKAHLEEDLRKAVRRYWKESREEPIYVIVKDGKKNILVDPYHIDYLQANGHYIDIIMDNEEPIVVRNHINELQHTLEKYGFVHFKLSYLYFYVQSGFKKRYNRKQSRNSLRYYCCIRHSRNAHTEGVDKQKVQPRVYYRSNGKIVKRSARIPHRAKYSRSHVV